MNRPVRIRLSRAKGWRKPANAVNVVRPSRWGNPYRVEVFGRELAVALFRRSLNGEWSTRDIPDELVVVGYAAHCTFE